MTKTSLLAAFSALVLAGATGFAIAQPGGDHSERWAERLAELDTDGDGAISAAEANAPQVQKFSEADQNGDGELTFDEMTAFQEAEREIRRAERRQKGFERLDADGNGTVSAAEFAVRGDKRFDRIDANDDGFVTLEEAEAAHENRRGRRGEGRRGGRGS